MVPRASHWEVKSRLLLSGNGTAAACDDSRVIAAQENISLETSHLKGNGPFFTLYSLARVHMFVSVYDGWECVFIFLRYQEEENLIQFSSSLDRWKPNREF